MSISELFSELRDTFIAGDFDLVEKTLIDREERLKKEIEEKKKELELAEERMKFEKLERVTLEFKLERLQAEMNKKMLMKKNGERGDREERLKKEIEEKKKELELFEERMKFEKLERVTLEFKLEKLQAEMNKKALTMKNGNQSGDVGAVKNRFVSDNDGVASADVEKASQHVGVWVKEKKKVDEQRKKDGLGVSGIKFLFLKTYLIITYTIFNK
jgi:predicted RNase H-like nuclease (RuvC/YqgF family)